MVAQSVEQVVNSHPNAGSSPAESSNSIEHLIKSQGVTGSKPVGPTIDYEVGGPGRNRTDDRQVMSLTSYYIAGSYLLFVE